MSTSAESRRSSGEPLSEEEQQLLDWMAKFNDRMTQKEQEAEKRATQQSIAAGQELAAVQERREKEELEAQLEAQRLEEERIRAEQQAAAEEAEAYRIEKMTANMTPEERERWLADDAELQRLEEEMNSRTGRMERVGTAINELVQQYEDRLKEEERQRIAAEEARQRAIEEFYREQHLERKKFDDEVLAEREILVQEEEGPERGKIHDQYEAEKQVALDRARQAVHQRLPEEAKLYVLSLPTQAQRNAVYDEVLEMEVLNAGLDKLLKKDGSKKQRSSQPAANVPVDAVEVIVREGTAAAAGTAACDSTPNAEPSSL